MGRAGTFEESGERVGAPGSPGDRGRAAGGGGAAEGGGDRLELTPEETETLASAPFHAVAPRIVVDPKPTTTDIGSDVTLTCVWVGNPPLTLTWTKKDSNMVRRLRPPCALGGRRHSQVGERGWGEAGAASLVRSKLECF